MIICLEGVNGSGKSTLATLLLTAWRARGGNATRVEPVQYTAFGNQVRGAVMATPDLDPAAEALAFAGARLHAARDLSCASRSPGTDLLIVERWAGAVTAYGRAGGVPPPLLEALEALLRRSLAIDRVFLVDTPGTVATARLLREPEHNRFETAGADYLERVRQAYLDWADERRVSVVSGRLSRGAAAAWAESVVGTFPPSPADTVPPSPADTVPPPDDHPDRADR